MFIVFVCNVTVYALTFCWVNLKKTMDAHEAFLKSPVPGILIKFAFIAVWFVAGLALFRLYLILAAAKMRVKSSPRIAQLSPPTIIPDMPKDMEMGSKQQTGRGGA